MPILFNFYILLATFYTIFWTNILIQCRVPVPVYCMFFVSQKPNIKRSPNGIKTDGDFFGIFMIFEKKNQRETMPEGPRGRGRTPGVRRALGPRGHPGHRFALILLTENHKYSKKNLCPFLSRLDSVWYWVSAKQKTCNKQELALGTGSIC